MLRFNHLTMALLVLLGSQSALADEVQVAVAANFTKPMEQIAADFEKATGHKARISYGTVGKFYAQIKNGAPFELLVASDDETPMRLEKDGLAIPKTRYTYAIGKLMLWSTMPGLVDDQGAVLKNGNFKHLSIANPKTAVYGAAAVDVMRKLGVLADLEPRFVQGENITQTYQFVATGNAELGFVALSQIYKDGQYAAGSYWAVPDHLYPALRQDAVLLAKGKGNPAAESLLAWLKTDAARKVIRAYGYTF